MEFEVFSMNDGNIIFFQLWYRKLVCDEARKKERREYYIFKHYFQMNVFI